MWLLNRHPHPTLKDSTAAADYLTPRFSGLTLERFVALGLDQRNRAFELHSIDGVAAWVEPHLRDLALNLIRVPYCGLIIAHNHPSGSLLWSRGDLVATKWIARFVGDLGAHLYDHILFANEEWVSMREQGYL